MTTYIDYLRVAEADAALRVAALVDILVAGEVGVQLHAYLEDPTRADGLELHDDLTPTAALRLPARWPIGRLFTQHGDLRWERTAGNGLHLVVIADGQLPASGHEPLELTLLAPHKILLWGEYRQGSWREERIPRMAARYPTTWRGPHAAIMAQTYEAPLPAHKPEFAGVRTIVRYLRYDGNLVLRTPRPRDEEPEL